MATPKQFRRRGRFALITAVLLGALAVTGVALGYVGTDQADYSPGSTVTISGGNDSSGAPGYVADNSVTVDASGGDGWTTSCSGTVAADGTWSCQVTLSSDPSIAAGSYSYTATSTAADGSPISESGTFTDTANQFTGAGITGDNSAFVGDMKTYTATTSDSGNCLNGATLGYSWSVDASSTGSATFSATTVVAPTVTFTAPGAVYLDVTVSIVSGGTCTSGGTSHDAQKEVDVTTTTTSLSFNPASPITYGQSTALSGTLTEQPSGAGIAGQPITVTKNSASDCSDATPTTIGTATTAGGPSTPPKGNWALASNYLPTAAGTQYIKAAFAGTGSDAASSTCESLVINQADTAVTSAPELTQTLGVYQAGATVPFNLDFEVSSANGVNPNNATGGVVATQSASGLGCDTANHAISAAQNKADGTGGAKAGFDYIADSTHNSGNRIGCTPTATGTYTVYVTFTDTDGNYNGSNDSPGSTVYVAPVNVQVCMAAPAIAAAYLQAHGVKNNTSKYVNIVSLIAGEMANSQQARFPTYAYSKPTLTGPGALIRPCEGGYSASVVAKTQYWIDNPKIK